MSTLSPLIILIILRLEYSKCTHWVTLELIHVFHRSGLGPRCLVVASFDCELELVVCHHFGHQFVTKALVWIVGSRQEHTTQFSPRLLIIC